MQRINAIRLRVFVLSFGMPILWLTLYLFRINSFDTPYKSYISLGLFVGSVLRLLFDETLYLIAIKEEGANSKLTYLNRFMQQKMEVQPLHEKGSVSFHKKSWFLDMPTAVTIWYEGKTRRFRLLTKEIEQDAKTVLLAGENEQQVNLSVN